MCIDEGVGAGVEGGIGTLVSGGASEERCVRTVNGHWWARCQWWCRFRHHGITAIGVGVSTDLGSGVDSGVGLG